MELLTVLVFLYLLATNLESFYNVGTSWSSTGSLWRTALGRARPAASRTDSQTSLSETSPSHTTSTQEHRWTRALRTARVFEGPLPPTWTMSAGGRQAFGVGYPGAAGPFDEEGAGAKMEAPGYPIKPARGTL